MSEDEAPASLGDDRGVFPIGSPDRFSN